MTPAQALFSLQKLQLVFDINTNEDWLDSEGYVTGPNDPNPNVAIPLDGILLVTTVRNSPGDIGNLLQATTVNGLMGILPASVGSTVNSSWMMQVYAAQLPGFLAAGTYYIEMQGFVGPYTRTLVTGVLNVHQGGS